MIRRLRKALAAAAVFTATALSTAVPVNAATYTAVNGSTVDIDVMLVMDKEALTPAETFSFKIEPGTAVNATSGNAKIYAGIGSPTIGTATFTVKQTTYNTAQATLTTGQNTTNGTTKITVIPTKVPGGGSADYNASTQVFAHSAVTVNFSGVSFTEPGIYRYKITETSVTPTQGITLDTTAKYLDVYVKDTEAATPTLQVAGYVLHDSASTQATSGTNPSGKAIGFTNLYTTYDLTLSKTVTGNAGSRDEYFDFTVTISGAQAGTKYTVSGNFDTSVPANAQIGTAAHTNPTEITVGTGGTITQHFYLQNGQNIKIQGLAKDTKYSINEDNTVLTNEGYSTTATVTGTGSFIASNRTATSKPASGTDTGVQADTTVAYTNSKTQVVPTGIIETILPGALLVVIAGAGFALIRRTGKE
ncbi:MAG: hypothetical protein IJ225_06480 [Solobacterium sp.]|nr:hypothetical protein [Solobacterium sp.]